MFTFGPGVPVPGLKCDLVPGLRGRVVCAAASGSGLAGPPGLALGGCPGGRAAGGAAWLWGRCGWRRERGPAFAAGFRRDAGGGAAVVFGLPVVVGGEDALVADGEGAGKPEHGGRQAHEPAPAAGDAGGGGVFDGGEGALGAGAPGVGAAPGWRGVVVFLPGLGCDVWADGDGLLGAAGGRVLRRG